MARDIVSQASSVPFPYDDPQAWQVTIGNINVDQKACLVTVKGLKTSNRVDVKDGPGADDATITHHGRKVATFSIALEAWKPEGAKILLAILLLAHQQPDEIAKATGEAPAMTVTHPVLALAGVNAMYVESIAWPEFGGGKLTASIECIQWKPAPKKRKSASKSLTVADVPTAFRPPASPPRPTLPSKSNKLTP